MFKIMFIDDDLLVLKHLNNILDWNSLGFVVLPPATDGNTALEKIKHDVPNIVICDINMPNMNGLELIEQLKIIHPDIQCIMLTINDSFQCAQDALNLGVNHYLLKPINPIDLKKLILNIASQLSTTQEHKDYVDSLYKKAKLNENMFRDKFMNYLVSGRQSLTEQEIKEKLCKYDINPTCTKFQIISIHLNTFSPNELSGDRLENLLHTITTSLEDTLSPYQNCTVFIDQFYQFNVLVGFTNNNANLNMNTRFLCQLIKEDLSFNLNIPSTIFYSRCYTGYTNIYRCYFDTKFLSKYNSTIMTKGVFSFDEYLNHAFDTQLDLDSIRTETLRALRSGNIDFLMSHVCNTLNHTFAQEAFDTFNILAIDFIMTGIMFLKENKLSIQDIFDKNYTPLSEITEANTPDKCISFLNYYFENIIKYVQTNKISSGRLIAEQCVLIINQNLSLQELSVRWISNKIYINENYLSRLFRKEMGISLNKFITKTRLKTAKKYMHDGYENLQSISQMVGFSDPLYFSKCFKKEYGVAPSQYLSTIK